ncbi:MAG: PEGA domain-containing protein [Planctomycetota bacterium]
MRAIAALLPLLLGALGGACRTTPAPGVFVASAPPGAQVLLDGRTTGLVTPCLLAVDGGRPHEISLVLPGYAAEGVEVRPAGRLQAATWLQGHARGELRFPLFLPAGDLFLPLELDPHPSPARIFLRLRPRPEG